MRTVISLILTSIVLVSVSEALYYPVAQVDPLLIGFYALPTALLLWTLRRYQVDSLPGVALAGAVYGFVVEGLLVPVLYEAPLFTFSYTSLAWHMLISVMVGWWMIGRGLRGGSVVRFGAALAGIGVFLGLWWPTWWQPGAEQIDWSIASFGGYIAVGTLVLAAGHAALAVIPVLPSPPARRHSVLLITIAVSAWAAMAVQAPLALVLLPALLGICHWGLSRQRGTGMALQAMDKPVRWRRFLLFVLVPLGAAAGYGGATLVEDPVIVADLSQSFIGGGQWLLGYLVLAWALVRRPESGRPV